MSTHNVGSNVQRVLLSPPPFSFQGSSHQLLLLPYTSLQKPKTHRNISNKPPSVLPHILSPVQWRFPFPGSIWQTLTDCRSGLGHLQYKLTHCKDHCWVLLNHMAFTTTTKRQTSMHWHCLNICFLYCCVSSGPNLDGNFLLIIRLQESSPTSCWLGASQDRVDASLW